MWLRHQNKLRGAMGKQAAALSWELPLGPQEPTSSLMTDAYNSITNKKKKDRYLIQVTRTTTRKVNAGTRTSTS